MGLRITDRDNANGALTNEGSDGDGRALSFNIPCAATPGPEGGACNITTTADAVLAAWCKEGQRSVWELAGPGFDGGADADGDTTGDNTLFAVQGLFAP